MRLRVSYVLLLSVLFSTCSKNSEADIGLIIEAENYLYDANYDAAHSCYKKIKSPRIKEMVNAIICSSIIGDFQTCTSWLALLVDRGLPLEYLEAHSVFNDFLKSNEYKKFLANDYVSHVSKYEKKVNESLIQNLDELITLDQSITENYQSATIMIDSVMGDLKSKYGDFTEDKLGIYMSLNNKKINILPKHLILFVHSFQRNRGDDFYSEHVSSNNAYSNDLRYVVNSGVKKELFKIGCDFYFNGANCSDNAIRILKNICTVKYTSYPFLLITTHTIISDNDLIAEYVKSNGILLLSEC